MNNRNRLFEVFGKVNRLVINEQISGQIENYKDDIENDIRRHFSVSDSFKFFSEGLPFRLNVNIDNQDVEFEINDEGGYDIENIDRNKYVVTYVTNMGNINPQFGNTKLLLNIPFILEINKNITNNAVDFYLKTIVVTNDIDIEYID